MNKCITTLLLLLIFTSAASFATEKPGTGIITGQIMLKSGKALSNGKVYFFKDGSGPPPSQSKYWRTPDDIIETDTDGRFAANLAEGKYYISAIKKMTNDLIGPPIDGDYIYPDSRKDLRQEQTIYTVTRDQVTDIGVISDVALFKKKTTAIEDNITAIEGIVVDSNGKPVTGAIAFAFLTSKIIGKPLFVSERTGKDGRFLLKVSQGGNYYVKIRTTLKGSHPETGEIIGVFGKDKPAAITLKTGEILRGITIIGKTFTNAGSKNSSKNKQLFNYGNKL